MKIKYNPMVPRYKHTYSRWGTFIMSFGFNAKPIKSEAYAYIIPKGHVCNDEPLVIMNPIWENELALEDLQQSTEGEGSERGEEEV